VLAQKVRVLNGTRAAVRVPAIHTAFTTGHSNFKIFHNKCTFSTDRVFDEAGSVEECRGISRYLLPRRWAPV